MSKKIKMTQKALKIAAVSAITFTSLSSIPFNTLASPVGEKIENVTTTSTDPRTLVNSLFENHDPSSNKIIKNLTFTELNSVAEQLTVNERADFFKANKLLIMEIIDFYEIKDGKLHISFKDDRYKQDLSLTTALSNSDFMTLDDGRPGKSILNGNVWISNENIGSDEEFWLHNQYMGSVISSKDLLDANNYEQKAEAREAVNNLFEDNNVATNKLKSTTTQTHINDAKAMIDKLPASTTKTALEADWKKAQELLVERTAEMVRQFEATNMLSNLFQDGKPATGNIISGITQNSIDTVQYRINLVTDTAVKQQLQEGLNRAQEQLTARETQTQAQEAREAVNNLFEDNNVATNKLKSTTTQTHINDAKAMIDKLPASTTKTALEADW
ncbi:toxin Cry1Ac domain D-VI-related protein, partial [Listeria booriae]|uniref:toxin Cry1Ac domain D-VI-related protein n=1 Tax=Listeria booriae TaxID=1552123 RepID=UPI0017C784F7